MSHYVMTKDQAERHLRNAVEWEKEAESRYDRSFTMAAIGHLEECEELVKSSEECRKQAEREFNLALESGQI